jgi:hypothetical protein
MVAKLEAGGVAGRTAVVACEPEAPLGKKLATLSTAYSIGGEFAAFYSSGMNLPVSIYYCGV